MFAQVIQGRVRDTQAAKEFMDRWQRDLEPGAQGWLGGTYGVTDDGTFVAVVRFESKEAARRNSQRPEQQAWWRETEANFAGEVVFHDCPDVTVLLGGGSDKATFVQVIQGRVRDRERARALAQQSGELISKYRPDILGATIAIDEDGHFTETVSFTSERDARQAERQDLPPEARHVADEEMSLLDEVRYLDLRRPWFASPG